MSDVTAREAVERFNLYDRHLTEGGGGYMETDNQGDWVRYSDYAVILTERDAAFAAGYAAGQEEMRERAAQEQEDCWRHGVPSVEHAKHIRALPLKPRP